MNGHGLLPLSGSSSVSILLSDKLNKDGISILTINSHLNELSEFIVQSLQPDFNKYGVGLENFYVVSVNVPEDDPSFIKLKEAKELMAKIKIAGRDIYQMDRSFNVLETAAGNEGTAGNLIGVGMGMNAGRISRTTHEYSGSCTSSNSTISQLLYCCQWSATRTIRCKYPHELYCSGADTKRYTCMEEWYAKLGTDFDIARIC